MKFSKEVKNRHLYEYAIWQCIDSYNQSPRVNEHGIIMVSEGRKLRDAIVAKCDKFPLTGVSTFKNAVNEVLGKRISDDIYHQNDGGLLNKQIADFSKFLNLSEAEDLGGGVSLVTGDDSFLPISPYDAQYRNLDIVMSNGSRLGSVSVGAGDSDYDLQKAYSLDYNKVLGKRHVKAGSLVTNNDISGISRLRRFCDPASFDNLADWYNKGVNFSKLREKSVEGVRLRKARNASFNRAEKILRMLDEMGYDYELGREYQTGQLKASIAGTSVSIRIADVDSKFIGRAYDAGLVISPSSTLVRNNKAFIPDLTDEQAIALVKFALGEYINDDRGLLMGSPGEVTRTVNNKPHKENAVSRSSSGVRIYMGKLYQDNGNGLMVPDRYGNYITATVNNSRAFRSNTAMTTPVEARDYLTTVISDARSNFANMVNLETLISDFNDNKDDSDWEPKYDANPEIASIQKSYIAVLKGIKATLLRPGVQADEFEELVETGDMPTSDYDKDEYENQLSMLTYPEDMDKEEMLRSHFEALVDHEVGSFEIGADGKRFNPKAVAQYQLAYYGIYRNLDDITKALRMLDIPADEIKGNNASATYVKDGLIKFDNLTAKNMAELDSPFMRSMYEEINNSLTSSGISVSNIMIDDKGIVQYTGSYSTSRDVKASSVMPVKGEIGQIFEPENKVIKTNFGSSNNFAFVPGYRGHVISQKAGETKSLMERTRAYGYEQELRKKIRYQIHHSLLSPLGEELIGSPVSLNSIYGNLYGTRFAYDFEDRFREQGMSEETISTIIDSASQTLLYDKSFEQGSTIHADYIASHNMFDMADDNKRTPYILTGGLNLTILDEDKLDNAVSSRVTSTTTTAQGRKMFLKSKTKVMPDGSLVPSPDKDDDTAMALWLDKSYGQFDAIDRFNMAASVTQHSNSVTEPVGTASLTFGGWGQDDGVVVSKSFAQAHGIRDANDKIRPLMIGDKISDKHGNKGVISIVIDPDMSDEEALDKGLSKAVKFFRDNPDVSVVMSPFSAVSRFNGGTAREAMTKTYDLYLDDRVVPGGVGEMSFIITDKAADIKTNIYDETSVRKRKISSQGITQAHAKAPETEGLEYHNAYARSVYMNNGGELSNLREYLITCGLDISDTGELRHGYKPHEGEVRNVIEFPEVEFRKDENGRLAATKSNGNVMVANRSDIMSSFKEKMEAMGGVLEVPFPLTYPTGEVIPPLNDGKTDVIYEAKEWERRGYTRKDGIYVPPTTVTRKASVGTRKVKDETYGLPLMSSYLRSGSEQGKNGVVTHDYTHAYETIIASSIDYISARKGLELASATEAQKALAKAAMEKAQFNAQTAYNSITSDITKRKFEGKHNQLREHIMSVSAENSATAVLSADPRLGIEDIGISRSIANSLGISDGDSVLAWRDPTLRDGSHRTLKANISDELTGVSINPSMAKSMDGDFDGDTLGIYAPKNKFVIKDLEAMFGTKNNLLDYGSLGDDGLYDLYMHDSLDVCVAMHFNPELKERWENIRKEINEFEAKYNNGEIFRGEIRVLRERAVESLNEFYKDAYDAPIGQAYLEYDNMPGYLKSVYNACIETGAKGNAKKFLSYCKYLGVSIPGATTADGQIKDVSSWDFENAIDHGHTLATKEDREGVLYATATKSFATGIAGAFYQRGILGLRNKCMKAVTELTYPVTQSLLQLKHDPAEAKVKYPVLMTSVRDLWRGAKMTKNDEGIWVSEKDAEGSLVMASKDEWKETFVEMYNDPNCLNVKINPKYVEIIADHLSKDGYMQNMESEDFLAENASPMDRLAYGGTFETWQNIAKDGSNIFEGEFNSLFKPREVYNNELIKYAREHDAIAIDNKVRVLTEASIAKKDTLEGKMRTRSTMPSMAVARKPIPEPVIETDSEGSCCFDM